MAPLFYQNLLWNLTALSIAAAFVRPARLPTRADGLFETSLALMDRRTALTFWQTSVVAATVSENMPQRTLATTSTSIPPRVWLDADPSAFVWTGLDCDDDLAILVAMALDANKMIQLEGLSVCGGNAPLRHTWKDMQVLIRHTDNPSMPNYYKGYGWRSMQVSRRWLQRLNQLQPDVADSNDAAEAIVKAAFSRSDQKLTVMTIGPPTNLAKALRQNQDLASQLEHVYMMGGELTQQRLDLNFASDRAAARTVVEANVPTTMIPIQLCAQVVLDDVFVQEAEAAYCNGENTASACAMLPKMKQQVKTMPDLVNQAVKKRIPKGGKWIPSPNLDRGFIPWDIVCILSLSHPEKFAEWEFHTAAFPTCPEGEPCDRTMFIQDIPKHLWPVSASMASFNHSGIVRIPHRIQDEQEIKGIIMDLLFQLQSNTNRPTPKIMLGFLGPLGSVGTTFATAFGLLRRRFWI